MIASTTPRIVNLWAFFFFTRMWYFSKYGLIFCNWFVLKSAAFLSVEKKCPQVDLGAQKQVFVVTEIWCNLLRNMRNMSQEQSSESTSQRTSLHSQRVSVRVMLFVRGENFQVFYCFCESVMVPQMSRGSLCVFFVFVAPVSVNHQTTCITATVHTSSLPFAKVDCV